MTIILAGGSGFLGRALTAHFHQRQHHVLNLTRRPRPNITTDIAWRPDGSTGPWADTLATTDVIVNLAGANLADKRWTERRKRLLRDSRILATQSLVGALNAAPPRQRLLISCSGVNFYGPHGGEAVTETMPPGDDFLARLCIDWEQEAARAASDQCRVAVIRSGMVLHPRGGALARMLPPFKFGLGASVGSGRQFMSWIHRDDWVALVTHIIAAHEADTDVHEGQPQSARTALRPRAETVAAYNGTAPGPVTNLDFTRTLAHVLGRPALFRAPAFALQLALGEMAQAALLSGARVLPARAEAEGFRFAYPELETALRDLLDRA